LRRLRLTLTPGADPTVATMTRNTLDIPALVGEFTAVHPAWNLQQQKIALALLRLLGQGEPVTVDALAAHVVLPGTEVAAFVAESPTLHRDEDGRVVAFGGLTLQSTSHALEADGHALHTWCALDTLFLPELLAASALVRSTCPATGQSVTLTVDDTGVHNVTPADAVLSLHTATATDLDDVIGTFCCFVHFFANDGAARAWAASRQGTFIASMAEGFDYGRLYNHARYAAIFDDESR
jgi:alkylmercury lyase